MTSHQRLPLGFASMVIKLCGVNSVIYESLIFQPLLLLEDHALIKTPLFLLASQKPKNKPKYYRAGLEASASSPDDLSLEPGAHCYVQLQLVINAQ